LTFCEASTLRDGIDAAHPHGYQVAMMNTARWGWVLKIQRRGGGPQDPTLPLFTSLPVWVCLIGDWPNAAEHLEIDMALAQQMGATLHKESELCSGKCAVEAPSKVSPPSAEPGPLNPEGEPVCP
jgi:hypothetical protein